MSRDHNLFLPKIVEQESLQYRAILQQVILIAPVIPVHRKIAVNHAHAIVDHFITLGKIVAANILVDGAPAAQFGEFFDEPG